MKYLLISMLALVSCNLLGNNKEHSFHEQADLVFSKGGSIYLMDTETGQSRFWAEGGSPRWSPEGERIAYTGLYKGWEAWQVFVMDVDRSNKRVVTLWEVQGRIEPHLSGGYSPVWSPDGDRLAFTRCTNCEVGGINTEVFTVELDTTKGIQEIRITNNSYSDHMEDWSPDGKRLLIQSEVRPDGSIDKSADLYTINFNGLEKQLVLENDSSSFIHKAQYSPNGKTIAVISGKNETNEIYIVDSNGTKIQRLTNNNLIERYVSWLPDGSGLVFVMGPEGFYGDRPDHIYTINLDGTGLRQLTSEPSEYADPHWRPKRK